jgi:hypothetical protein
MRCSRSFPTRTALVVRVFNVGLTNVVVVYSKLVEAASATNVANYVFTNGLAVTRAALNADNQTVVLDDRAADLWQQLLARHQRRARPGGDAEHDCHEHDGDFCSAAVCAAGSGQSGGQFDRHRRGQRLNVTAAGSDFGGNSDQGNFPINLQRQF